jgi:hypothetical protein
MATFTVHQWPDLQAGLAEMRRVTRNTILILTCDPDLERDGGVQACLSRSAETWV